MTPSQYYGGLPSLRSPFYAGIVIGTGSGGKQARLTLAPSAKRILLLKQGGLLLRDKDYWSLKTPFMNHHRAKET